MAINTQLIGLALHVQRQRERDAQRQEEFQTRKQQQGMNFLLRAIENDENVNLDNLTQIPGISFSTEALGAAKELQKSRKRQTKFKEAKGASTELGESFARQADPRTGALSFEPGQLSQTTDLFDQLTQDLSPSDANRVGALASARAGARERQAVLRIRQNEAQTEAERQRGRQTTRENAIREQQKLSEFERSLQRAVKEGLIDPVAANQLKVERIKNAAAGSGETITIGPDGSVTIARGPSGMLGGAGREDLASRQENAVIAIDDLTSLRDSIRANPKASGIPGLLFGAVAESFGFVRDISESFGGDVGDWAARTEDRIKSDVVAGRADPEVLDLITSERGANEALAELLAYSLAAVDKKSGRVTIQDIENKRKLVNPARLNSRAKILARIDEVLRVTKRREQGLSRRMKQQGMDPVVPGTGVRGSPSRSEGELPLFELDESGEYQLPKGFDFDLEETEDGTFRVVPK